MKIMSQVIAGILVAIIPIIALLLAGNIVFRVPYIYQYEFRAQEVFHEIDLNVSEEDFGEQVSDYLLHKSNEFQLEGEYNNRVQEIFNTEEQIAIGSYRTFLDKLFLLGVVLLAAAIVIYVVLRHWKEKQLLRTAFKFSTAVFTVCFVLIMIAASNTEQIQRFFFEHVFSYEFVADDLIPDLFTGNVIRGLLSASNVVAIVLMAFMGYLTWKLTRPRMMFGNER